MSFHHLMEGADLHAPSKFVVKNNTASILTGLTAVKFTNHIDGVPTVAPISSFNDNVAGLITKDIGIGETGDMPGLSFAFNIDTSAFSAGNTLYSDDSGVVSATPSVLKVGCVITSDATIGILFIDAVKSVPDAGSVEVHSDVTSAGSGAIITTSERTQITVNNSLINGSLLTSYVSGLQITPNVADPELFDMAAGEMYVTVHNGPVGSTGQLIPVDEQIGVPHAGGPASRIVLDSVGTLEVESFTGQLTQKEKLNGKLQIKILSHLGGLVSSPIDVTFTTISALFGDTFQSNSVMFASGTILSGGLGLVLNSDLTFGRLIGNEFDPLATNLFTDPDDPYLPTFAAIPSAIFFSTWMGNDINSINLNPLQTDIDPNSWDDTSLAPGVGSPDGALSGNQAQNFSVHEAINDSGTTLAVQYGRELYSTLADAEVAAINEMSRINSLTILGSSFRGMISVPRAVTNLNTQASFTPPSSRMISTLRGTE